MIGSTQTVDAFSHTNVQGPVFLIDGTKLADDSTDLWDGRLLTPLNITELGTTLNTIVFTGSNTWGEIESHHLGSGDIVGIGGSAYRDEFWIQIGAQYDFTPGSYNAISTAIIDSPEPATAWLLVIPLALAYRRIQRYPAACSSNSSA